MSQHTPGPHYVERIDTPQFGDDEAYEIRTDPRPQHGALLATVHLQGGRTRANANLYAAAPDLLEALEDCLEGMREQGVELCEHITVAKARAAIAKARGE